MTLGAGGLETDQYYFHPDHLGSSNYITNFVGEVSQHSEYFAFGETFIEEHKDSHNSPYKFNGKELDEESGLYYYGARYYDPRISIWASVDPLMEQTMSAYGYCNLNPVNLIDPTGMEPDDWIGLNLGDGTYKPVWRENVTGKDDKDIGAGNIYIGKEERINCLDGNVWQLNKDGSGYIVDAKGNKTSIGDNIKETPKSGKLKTEIPPNNSLSSKKTENKVGTPSTSSGISTGTTLALGAGADYYTLSGSLPIFGFLNVGFTISLDRFGQVYITPSGGIGSKGASLSFYTNYLINQPNKNEQEMKNFLTGWGSSVSGGYYFGVQASSSGPNPLGGNYSMGLGLTTPGGGVNYGFTWMLYDFD